MGGTRKPAPLPIIGAPGYTQSSTVIWGGPEYTAVPGDYDGDGSADYALYVPTSGLWTILLSTTSYATQMNKSLGGEGYVPVPGDYDGDGKTDPTVFKPADGTWLILASGTTLPASRR